MAPLPEGPLVAALTHRLAECPGEFLEPALVGNQGIVHVDAVVCDVVRHMGGEMLAARETDVLRSGLGREKRNHLQVALVAAWLLHDPWFADRRHLAGAVLPLVAGRLVEFAGVVPAHDCVGDADRREELVRLCLTSLGVQPGAEHPAESADRLASLDSVQRLRVIEEFRAAELTKKKEEERARKIKEAMAKKEAEEAAARYGRE